MTTRKPILFLKFPWDFLFEQRNCLLNKLQIEFFFVKGYFSSLFSVISKYFHKHIVARINLNSDSIPATNITRYNVLFDLGVFIYVRY